MHCDGSQSAPPPDGAVGSHCSPGRSTTALPPVQSGVVVGTGVVVGATVGVAVRVGVRVGVGVTTCALAVGVAVAPVATGSGRNCALPGKVKRPRPGRPATAFTDVDDVGGRQKNAPSVGDDWPLTGGSGVPCTCTEAPTCPLSV